VRSSSQERSNPRKLGPAATAIHGYTTLTGYFRHLQPLHHPAERHQRSAMVSRPGSSPDETLPTLPSLKFGVVGIGRIGQRHAINLLRRVPNAKLVCVCSPAQADLEWAKRELARYGTLHGRPRRSFCRAYRDRRVDFQHLRGNDPVSRPSGSRRFKPDDSPLPAHVRKPKAWHSCAVREASLSYNG
jgi:hypothetical protein